MDLRNLRAWFISYYKKNVWKPWWAISKGRMQGAANAANAAPRNGSHQFSEMSFRFYKSCEQDSQIDSQSNVAVGNTAARRWHGLEDTIFLVVPFLTQFPIPCNLLIVLASFPTTNIQIFWAVRCVLF